MSKTIQAAHAAVSKVWNGWGYHFSGTASADYIKGSILNDKLYGNAGKDTLDGGWGNDLLDGGSGADVMKGGAGNDTYYVDDVCDEVIECKGEGTDTVMSSVSYTLTDHVENLTALGCDDVCLTGNAQDNRITGNSGDNCIDGGAGCDILRGGEGDDRVFGGLGNDALYGDAGNDLLDGGAGCDILIGGTGNDVYVYSAGKDIINNCDDGCGIDVLYFADNVCLSDVSFSRVCEDLVVSTRDGHATTVNDWFKGGNNQLDAFFFQQEDGLIDAQQINQALGKSAYGCVDASAFCLVDDIAVQCQVQCVA